MKHSSFACCSGQVSNSKKQRTIYWGPQTISASKQTFADERNINEKFEFFSFFLERNEFLNWVWPSVESGKDHLFFFIYFKYTLISPDLFENASWNSDTIWTTSKLSWIFCETFFRYVNFFLSKARNRVFQTPYLKDLSSEGEHPPYMSCHKDFLPINNNRKLRCLIRKTQAED